MNKSCNFDKSVSAQIGYDIQTLAQPLRKYYNITQFGYMKIYSDASQISISTHPQWLKCLYETLHHHGSYNKTLNAHTEGYHLWSQLKDKFLHPIMSIDFKMDHGITLVKKNKNTCEIFSFSTCPENHSIVNWYLNNLDILESFNLYFKEKGQPLIRRAEKDRLILPKCSQANTDDILYPFTKSTNDNLSQSFFKEIQIQRLLISDLSKKCYLTHKELSCVAQVIKGKSIKEIAKSMNLSPRTVETYLNNIKFKLNAKNMAEMVAKIIKFPGLDSVISGLK